MKEQFVKCPHCGTTLDASDFNLNESTVAQCPQCGRDFDPAKAARQANAPREMHRETKNDAAKTEGKPKKKKRYNLYRGIDGVVGWCRTLQAISFVLGILTLVAYGAGLLLIIGAVWLQVAEVLLRAVKRHLQVQRRIYALLKEKK